jgi:PEP-CTERM motif-containing protein
MRYGDACGTGMGIETMKLRVLLLAAVAAFAPTGAARADVVIFDWLAKITNIEGGGSAYSLNQTIKLSLTYDTSVLPSQIQNGGATAVYTSGMEFIRFGNQMWSIDNSGIFGQSQISNNRPAGAAFTDEVTYQGQNFNDNSYVTFIFALTGTNPQALNTTGLPTSLVNPAAFGSALATYVVDGVTYTAQISAIPGTIPGAVPEPSTWALMLFGFAGVGYLAWRRSKKLVVAAA